MRCSLAKTLAGWATDKPGAPCVRASLPLSPGTFRVGMNARTGRRMELLSVTIPDRSHSSMETLCAKASFHQSVRPLSGARFGREPETWGFMATKPNTESWLNMGKDHTIPGTKGQHNSGKICGTMLSGLFPQSSQIYFSWSSFPWDSSQDAPRCSVTKVEACQLHRPRS